VQFRQSAHGVSLNDSHLLCAALGAPGLHATIARCALTLAFAAAISDAIETELAREAHGSAAVELDGRELFRVMGTAGFVLQKSLGDFCVVYEINAYCRDANATSAGMAVPKGDPDFLAFLNTWLDMQRESGWLAGRAGHWATSTEGFR
jgi:hypothetical protein